MPATRNPDEDALLALACRGGDAAAFRILFERYREPMFRLAFRFAENADDAEDLAQEIFVRVYERIGSFRAESAFSTWLYRLATRVCLNHRRGIRDVRSLDSLDEEPAGRAPNPAEALEQAEAGDRIRLAVAALPEPLRVVFVLAGMEEWPYARVAAALDLTVEAVRMRMSRARRELRKRLAEDAGAPVGAPDEKG